MGHLSDTVISATFAAMQKHLQLVEEYSYFQGTTSYVIKITMGDSDFAMVFEPLGHIQLSDMRVMCLPVITKNIADIHNCTCACIFDIRESVSSAIDLSELYLELADEDYH